LQVQELKAAVAARLAGAGDPDDDDTLTDESNAVLDLIRAGRLDEAEAAARALLARYPDVHDGWDRLGMVYEARGDNAQAADCYRRVVAFLDENPGYSEPAFRASFVERIARLAPPAAT
jgi:tetratricopeptide (TPR) repeat protein